MDTIRNIVFDLGGVLLNIDPSKTFEEFEKLGLTGARELFHRSDIKMVLDDFESGVYCAVEFRNKFREITGLTVTEEQFDHAWNAMLLDLPPERINRVKELAKKYKTYLLSNTTPIHSKCFNRKLEQVTGLESFDQLLDKAWYSYNLGLRKPDIRIFEKVLVKSRLNPSETLYIDDYEVNVKAAEQAGMKGLVVNGAFTILEGLKGF